MEFIESSVFKLGRFFRRFDEKFGEKLKKKKEKMLLFCLKLKHKFREGRYPNKEKDNEEKDHEEKENEEKDHEEKENQEINEEINGDTNEE